ncbi:MAG: 50S ribosomal protein L9 [Firmicutes bacterium]|nr:50S ribosomal protein L9 [Bacillota bacterium]
MKVLLLEDVKGHGKKNDIVKVSDGYAKNFLIPRKLALEATPAVMHEVEMRHEEEKRREAEERREAEKTAELLGGKIIKLSLKKSADGKVFGSITSKDICDALEAQHKIKIEKHKLMLTEPIKSFGTFEVKVKIYGDVTGTLNVLITEK